MDGQFETKLYTEDKTKAAQNGGSTLRETQLIYTASFITVKNAFMSFYHKEDILNQNNAIEAGCT